jgi:MIP family channel proteins
MLKAWGAVIAEMGGTFLFFFVGIGAVGAVTSGWFAANPADPAASLVVIALAHGVVLAVLVSALGAVSGAHFNPAVTFGVWIAGAIAWRRGLAYVLAQLIGAILAALAVRAVFPADVFPSLGIPALFDQISPLVGILIETILTVVLLAAVFGTAVDSRAPKIGGLAIGLAVAADILMGGPLTGAAMNPARWFGPAAVTGDWTDGYVWIIGPLLGGLIAALAFRYLFLPEADAARTPAEPTA